MDWKAECMEQARLNGMGAERELKLMAERDRLRNVLAVLYEAYGVPSEMVSRVRKALNLPDEG